MAVREAKNKKSKEKAHDHGGAPVGARRRARSVLTGAAEKGDVSLETKKS